MLFLAENHLRCILAQEGKQNVTQTHGSLSYPTPLCEMENLAEQQLEPSITPLDH